MIQMSMFDEDKTEQALMLINTFATQAVRRNSLGYAVGYSGGKDSEVLVDLFIKAKAKYGDRIKFIVFHTHTGLDAPETVYFIRKKFDKWKSQGIDCRIYLPSENFWHLCRRKKTLPTRIMRFCCDKLKERNDIEELQFAMRAFGVRKSESVKREAVRDSIETRDTVKYGTKSDKRYRFDDAEDVAQTSACYTNKFFIVNPLAYWTENDVWNYIKSNNVEVNPLYAQGDKRVGCIGCPMAGKHRQEELARYPKYEKLYRKLCDDVFKSLQDDGKESKNWHSGEDMFNWWMEK